MGIQEQYENAIYTAYIKLVGMPQWQFEALEKTFSARMKRRGFSSKCIRFGESLILEAKTYRQEKKEGNGGRKVD